MSSTIPQPSPTPPAKSHNIATFAGAVGGSVGLLSLLAISLAFSIYRRKARSKRRDRNARASRQSGEAASFTESFHTEASEDGPPMQGPAPFVPRYFPGTVPAAPPAYTPSSGSSSNPIGEVTTSLFSSVVVTPRANDSDSASYADRPPPTPPPGDDGDYAPPSFQSAITSPVPAILARFSNLTSSQASQAASAAHSFRLPFSLPSRRPSQSSGSGRSAHRTSSHSQRLSRPSSARSSLRRENRNSTQPLLSQLISQDQPDSSSISEHLQVPSRPPSSLSESPPSISPPAEVLQAEREREEEELRTQHSGDNSSPV